MTPPASAPDPDFTPVWYLVILTMAVVIFGVCVTQVAENREARAGVALAVFLGGLAVWRLSKHVEADRAARPRVKKGADDPPPQGPRPAGVPTPEPELWPAILLPALLAVLFVINAIDENHWALRALYVVGALVMVHSSVRRILTRRRVTS